MKSSENQYQVRQILALFCNLIALFLRQNSVKGLKVTKNVKEIKFEEVWSKSESKKLSRDNFSQNIWN